MTCLDVIHGAFVFSVSFAIIKSEAFQALQAHTYSTRADDLQRVRFMCRDTSSPYLTNSEAAAYLRIKPRTLANMRNNGLGPAHRKHGGRVVYAIEDLIAWSNSTRRGGK